MAGISNDQVLVNEIKRAIDQLTAAVERARKEGLCIRNNKGDMFEVTEFDRLNIYRKYY